MGFIYISGYIITTYFSIFFSLYIFIYKQKKYINRSINDLKTPCIHKTIINLHICLYKYKPHTHISTYSKIKSNQMYKIQLCKMT